VDSDENNLDYRSRRYNSLLPGEYRDITVSFDNLPDDGRYEFDIEIDPDRDTREETRSNNDLNLDIDVD
ncbi:MAG: hypothetical protein MRY49_01410, partial [Candidatus Pacebacteria bacterium]|nr:hypothetical protein [Candidatus Paceibacterota bacterium]